MALNWELPHRFETPDGTVRYNVVGSGAPMVLVHGTPWSSVTWHRLVPILTDRYRVHYYDLIGYGQSTMRDGQDVSLARQGALLAELLQHWKLTEPTVIAHDIGGATALRAHLLHGADYRALVLMDPVALAPWRSSFFAHVAKHRDAFTGLPAYVHKAVVEIYIRGALSAAISDEDFDSLVAPWLTPAGQDAFYRQMAQVVQRDTDEIEPRYGEVRCPTLILWGENDPWIPVAKGRQLHAAIPGSQFQAIPNAGHLLPFEAPDVVAAAMRQFLAAV